MEESSLQQKIKKQLQYIRQQVTKFTRSFSTKSIKSTNFTPYLQSLHRVFDLNNSYGQDYYQFIQKQNLQFVLTNNRILMKDICAKLKELSAVVQQMNKPLQYNSKAQRNQDGICKLCNLHIESQSIQVAKSSVEDTGITELKRMLKRIQIQSNQALFSPEEDTYFFQELNRVLTGKEQVLSITDNHLEKYLDDIMKNIQEIKYLQNLKDTTFPLPTSINWQAKIKNQIHYVLLSTFKGKFPPWIQKTFQYFVKLHQKLMRQFRQQQQCQTDPYVQDEVIELRKEIEQRNQEDKLQKVINQDYVKTISEREEKIKGLEIEVTALKESLFSGQINANKLYANGSKQRKSHRSSILSNSQQLPQLNNNNKSKFKPRLSNSFHGTIQIPNPNSDSIAEITQGQMKTSNELETRKDQSVTEHLGSSLFATVVKKKKHKKYSIEINFTKSKLNQANNNSKSFLPSIGKHYGDSLEVPSNNSLKKTSILQIYSQPSKQSQQKHKTLQNSPSYQRRMQPSQSIIQVQQSNQKDTPQSSELNLTQGMSQSQRQIRIKKYRETITDVRGHLENKIKNNQNIRKLRKSSRLSLNAKWNPTQLFHPHSSFCQVDGKNSMGSKITFDQGIQYEEGDFINSHDDKVQEIERKISKYQQKIESLMINADSKRSELKQKSIKVEKISKQVQTGETSQSLLQKLQKTNINQDHLQKILAKLLQKSQKNHKADKQNIDPQTTRNRCTAKSMFTQHSPDKCIQLSPQKRQKKHTTKLQQSTLTSSRQQLKQLQTCLFTKKDFTLFMNQQSAFKYESNLKQKYHKSPFTQLTQSQTRYFTSLFNILQLIKNHSLHQYNSILSFIKYPYQTVVNNFSILNIVKKMSLESWLWYWARIKYCHQKCLQKNDDREMICCHVERFVEKVQNILVEATAFSISRDQTIQ